MICLTVFASSSHLDCSQISKILSVIVSNISKVNLFNNDWTFLSTSSSSKIGVTPSGAYLTSSFLTLDFGTHALADFSKGLMSSGAIVGSLSPFLADWLFLFDLSAVEPPPPPLLLEPFLEFCAPSGYWPPLPDIELNLPGIALPNLLLPPLCIPEPYFLFSLCVATIPKPNNLLFHSSSTSS